MDGGREGGRGKGRSPDGIVAGGGVRQADDVASMRVPKHTVLLVVGVASESGVSLGGEAPVRLRGLHDQGGGGAAHEPRSEECHLNMSMAVSRGRTPAQCQCHEPPRTNRTANVAAVGTASRCQPAPVRVPTAVPAETVREIERAGAARVRVLSILHVIYSATKASTGLARCHDYATIIWFFWCYTILVIAFSPSFCLDSRLFAPCSLAARKSVQLKGVPDCPL